MMNVIDCLKSLPRRKNPASSTQERRSLLRVESVPTLQAGHKDHTAFADYYLMACMPYSCISRLWLVVVVVDRSLNPLRCGVWVYPHRPWQYLKAITRTV